MSLKKPELPPNLRQHAPPPPPQRYPLVSSAAAPASRAVAHGLVGRRVPPRFARPDGVPVPPRLTAEVAQASSFGSQTRPGGWEDDHADQSQERPDRIEEGRRRRRWPETQRAAAAAAAVQGAGGGGRARALAARRGGAQGLGVHQAARA